MSSEKRLQSTGVYKLLLSNCQYPSDNQHRMINTFTPIIQRIISVGAARLHIAAYCDRDFSSMAHITKYQSKGQPTAASSGRFPCGHWSICCSISILIYMHVLFNPTVHAIVLFFYHANITFSFLSICYHENMPPLLW